jgi:two-component system, cell cycle response regulator
MVSFKLRLVFWFALLALVPLGIAFYGYDSLAKRSETRRTDGGLESALRGALAGYAISLESATSRAEQLARDPRLQRALRRGDRPTLRRLVARVEGAAVFDGVTEIGITSSPAAVRTVTVVAGNRILGRVSVRVVINAALLARLGAGLAPGDRLVAVQADRIVGGAPSGAPLALRSGAAGRIVVGGTAYRGLATVPLSEPQGLSFAALAPQSTLDAGARTSERRIAIALLSSLVLLGGITYLLGKSVVGTLRRFADAAHSIAGGRLAERVEVRGRDEFAQLARAFNDMASQLEQRRLDVQTERARVREATERLGEALTSTHDPRQLLRVVVESAVEATGAEGGIVIGRDGEIARAGEPEAAGERIAFPMRAGASDFGHLVIVSASFDAGQIEAARSLSSQAVVALENAQLHRIVQHQALIDSLTGLANRRSAEDTLKFELARATRFGGEICVVLADLDDFKQINDRYGHPFGDELLKEFANALRATVRESDVAARWGGEEFALVLPGTGAEGGADLANRVREIVEGRMVQAPDGTDVRVTGSFGVASFPESEELGELLAAADSALYAAKREGKNRVVVSAESVKPYIG